MGPVVWGPVVWSKSSMMRWLERGSLTRSASLAVLALALAGPAMPLAAQDNLAEARIRAMEAQIRALQRKVFPGDGKFFGPEIVAPGVAASGTPAASVVGDLASRLESVETQLKRLTAQAEENGNRLAQLETRVNGASPAPAATAGAAPGQAVSPAAVVAAKPTPTPTPTPTVSTPDSNLSAMTGGASALNDGRVMTVTDGEVQVEELVPDGIGGFYKRSAAIGLTD